MPKSPSGADLISGYLDAVQRKDVSAVDRYFDPNVEYIVNGPPTSDASRAMLPWFGQYRGREELKAFLAHMHRNLDVTAFGPREIIADGDRAAAFGWFRLHAFATNRTVDIPYAIRVEIRKGLIAKYHFLESTLDVATAFRSSGDWMMATDQPLVIQPFAASEAGAWSNSYLIMGRTSAVLFDVVQRRSEAMRLADTIADSGRVLETVMISHAHPDHFMGLDVIVDRFPAARVVSTPAVVEDIRKDGPWMLSLLQQKLGPEGPQRLIVPEPLTDLALDIDGIHGEILEFAEGESRHLAALHIPAMQALLSADLVYNGAHLYLQEHHAEGWLARLDELEAFVIAQPVTIYPGHGLPGGRELVDATRAYIRDFAEAVKTGSPSAAQERMLQRYPSYRVAQFLTAFSIPAYFPTNSG